MIILYHTERKIKEVKMYWCENCKSLVDGIEAHESEYHSEVGAYEEWDGIVCESCGEPVDDAGTCMLCGEECNPNETLCSLCEHEIWDWATKFIDELHESFKVKKTDIASYIAEVIDNIEFREVNDEV